MGFSEKKNWSFVCFMLFSERSFQDLANGMWIVLEILALQVSKIDMDKRILSKDQ